MKFFAVALFALSVSSAFAQEKEPVDIEGKAFLPVTITMERNSARGLTLDDLKVSIVSFLGGQKYSNGFSYALGTDLGSYKARKVLTDAGAFNSQSIEVASARLVTKQEIGSKLVLGLELYWGFGKPLKTLDHHTDFDITNYENYVNANCVDCSETHFNGVLNSDSGIKVTADYQRLKLTLFTNRYTHNMRGENLSAAQPEQDYFNWTIDGFNRFEQKTRGIEISYLALQKSNFSLRPFIRNEWTRTNQELHMFDYREVGGADSQSVSSSTAMRSVFTVGVKMDLNFNKKKKPKN